MKIKVITETAADLPLDVIKKNNIEVISHIITFEDKAYRLGKDISFDEYYDILESIEKIPTTAAPDEASFFEVFEKYTKNDNYDYAVCVTVSKELSATYSSAMLCVKKIGEKAILLDSGSASGVQGLIVLNIVELANKGKTLNEIKNSIERLKEESLLCAGFHTFENIYKSGRLKSKFILNATKFMRIKPILILQDKKTLEPKFPGFFSEKQMLKRILKVSSKQVNRDLVFDMVISHVNNLAGAEKLAIKIREKLKIRNEFVTIATPIVGTHTGKKTIILSLVPVIDQ